MINFQRPAFQDLNNFCNKDFVYEAISLLKIRQRQTSVTASGSEITARKTSGCRRCEVSRRSGLVCDVKKAILPLRVKRE